MFCNGTHFPAYNQLTGKLPTEVGQLTKLGVLNVENQLTGKLPTEVGHLTNLSSLKLRKSCLSVFVLGREKAEPYSCLLFCNGTHFPERNHLTGNLPTEVGYLTKLLYLSMGKSCLPFLIWRRTLNLNQVFCFAMAHIFSDFNQLTGKVPTEVGLLTNLVYLNMGKSCLSSLFRGGIPGREEY
jgi:Leucine-rich repeat (LRR) protein